MPFFELRRDDKSLDPLASEKLVAVMLYPKNRAARERMLAKIQSETAQETGRRRPFSRAEFFSLASQNAGRGAVAGGLLLTRLQLHRNGYTYSFNRARPLVLALLPLWEQPIGADQLPEVRPGHCPRSRRKMLLAWNDFRSVAHLWAAALHGLQHDRKDIWPIPSSTVANFLSYADEFLDLGCDLPSRDRARRFCLDRAEAWTFRTPDPVKRIGLEALPLHPEQRKILDDPQRSKSLR